MTDEKPVPEWRSLSMDERRARILEVLPNLWTILEGKDVETLGLFGVLAGAVENLHGYMEGDPDGGSTWENPFVELHYPVEWDWAGMAPIPVHAFPDEDLETEARVVERLAEDQIRVLHLEVMKRLTRGAAVHIKDGVPLPLIAPEVQAAADAMSEEERDAFFADFGEPFEVGGVLSAVPEEDEPEDGAEVAPGLAARLELAEPFLEFSGDVNGEPFSGSTYFRVDPLVVHEDEKRAFYPVTVGLFVHPKADGTEHDFGSLPREDRESFWKVFIGTIREAEEKLWAKTEPTGWKKREEPSASGEAGAVSGAEATATVEKAPVELAPALVPLPRPARTTPLRSRPTLVSHEMNALVRHAGGLVLPRKWSKVPTWEALVAEEISDILDRHGERAFRDPPLLKKETDRKTKETRVSLTWEAEEALADRAGLKGYRKLLSDDDRTVEREYLVRRFRAGDGHVEARLSWYDLAEPFHAGAVAETRRHLEARLQKLKEPALFEDLNVEERASVEDSLRTLSYIEDGRLVIERVGRELLAGGQNPVVLPAWELKNLLRCHGADNAMERVRGVLSALEKIRYSISIVRGNRPSHHVRGVFLKSVGEEKKGAGKHGEGDFYLEVSREFLGCLNVFKVRDNLLRGRSTVFFSLQKELSDAEKKDLEKGFLRGFSLSSHYDVAEGFTKEQGLLRGWIESQVTRRKDPVPKARKRLRVRATAPDADEPRLYGSDFCPLIPEGRLLACALSNFRRNPEAGWTLGGTTGRATATGGPHVGGLLEVMGYYYPPGAAYQTRQAIVAQALRDIVRVVESFKGVVAVRSEAGAWLTVDEVAGYQEPELVRKLKWFLFVTPDLQGHMDGRVQEDLDVKTQKGVLPVRVRVERAAPPGAPEPLVGLEHEELRVRLRQKRIERKLSQADVAVLFGVTRQALSTWESEKKPIPAELEGLVLRWVETGQAPTAEELASRRNRRAGVNPETGKPWKERDDEDGPAGAS